MKIPSTGLSPALNPEETDFLPLMRQIALSGLQNETAFLVCDQTKIEQKGLEVKAGNPDVKPYFGNYLLQCKYNEKNPIKWPCITDLYSNSHSLVLSTLSDLGFGFHCRNKVDLRLALESGIKPENILLDSPILVESHLKLASAKKVGLVGFRTENELRKIVKTFPSARFVKTKTIKLNN